MNTRTQAGETVRAIEALRVMRHRQMDAAKWNDFVQIMRAYHQAMLRGIEATIRAGHSAYYPATIPGFAMKCDAVFGRGLGSYDHEMMNVWLYANDLKHLLHAEQGGVIRW